MAQSGRGSSYPSINLEEAIKKLRLVYEQVGKGPSSKEAYIKGLGYSGMSGASNRTFAALTHFGLLSKNSQAYKISELGMSILYPRPEEDVSGLLVKAALAPRLFGLIYERYLGEKLPVLLANTLIHDFHVYEKSSKEAADNFQRSVEYAGLLDSEGHLQTKGDSLGSDQVTNDKSSLTELTHNTPKINNNLILSDSLRELPSGIKISFPGTLDFAVLTGEFGVEIKGLETKAQNLLSKLISSAGKDPDNENAQ